MKGKILSSVPYQETLDLARALLKAGLSREEVAQEIAAFLDAKVDFRKLIKGVVGEVAESLDGAVFYAIALAIAQIVTRDAS